MRKIDTSGIITTVAGADTAPNGHSTTLPPTNTPATSFAIGAAYGLAIDSSNNLYIADEANNVVRVVYASSGKIATFAGTGVDAGVLGGCPTTTYNTSFNGGLATAANLCRPFGVVTGDFAIASGGTCDFSTIAAGASCTVNVTFSPTQTGTRTGNITLYAEGPYTIPAVINLSGAGTSAALTAQTIAFANPGAQTVGTPLALSATAASTCAPVGASRFASSRPTTSSPPSTTASTTTKTTCASARASCCASEQRFVADQAKFRALFRQLRQLLVP